VLAAVAGWKDQRRQRLVEDRRSTCTQNDTTRDVDRNLHNYHPIHVQTSASISAVVRSTPSKFGNDIAR